MKKLIIISLILIIMLFAVACGSSGSLKATNTEDTSNTKTISNTEASSKTSEMLSLDATSSISDGSILNNENSTDSKSEVNKIKIVTPDGDIIIALEDNSATKDLLSRLPLTLHFDDYNNTEKISYIDNALDTSSAVTEYVPKAGSFAYYIPWGNLSLFYEDFRQSSGLASLGIVETGMEYVKKMDSYDSVTIEAFNTVINEQTKESVSETNSTEKTSKTLVAYFSCTGNTKNIADNIANSLNADTYEIKPKQAYTSEDLNYNDKNSRSTKEMNDTNSRPEIVGSISNWEDYDTVYIGYPIWWGEAPRILDTFVESYDFTGKTVIPFCTSSSSGIGSSGNNLASLSKSGVWKDGKRFSGNESTSEIINWVNNL